jgi:hypothetical protein
MPLPEHSPARVRAPARAGVGLRFRPREPLPWWPADWWQRNYDDWFEPDDPDPEPLTEREMHVPPAPPP